MESTKMTFEVPSEFIRNVSSPAVTHPIAEVILGQLDFLGVAC